MPVPQRIDNRLLDELSLAARQRPRLRLNHNLHEDYLDPPRPECFVLLRGRMAVLLFTEDGGIDEIIPLTASGPCWGVDIPPGAWHSLVSLAPGTVFFETKPGPYLPLADKDFAPWAPAEESTEAGDYLHFLTGLVHERGSHA